MPVITLGKSGDVKKDIENALNDLAAQIDSVKNIGDDVPNLRQSLGELKALFDGLNSRLAATPSLGSKYRLPAMTKREWTRHGMMAVYKAPTLVEPVYDRFGRLDGWKENENPVARMQDAGDLVYLYAKVKNLVDPREVRDHFLFREFYLPAYLEVVEMLKGVGFDTAGAGEGLEWIPSEFSSRMFEKVRLETVVLQWFESVPMPRSPFKYPTWVTDLIGYYIGETTDDTSPAGTKIANAGAPGSVTGNVTLTAKKIAGAVYVSKELEEDAVPVVLPAMQKGLVVATARAAEDAAINGDTAGTHQDSDVTTATDRRKAWDGLRKIALAAAATKLSAGGNTIDTTSEWSTYVGGLRGQMNRYGVYGRNVAFIVGPKLFNQILNVPEFRTLYAIGQRATAVEVSPDFRPDGMTLIVSEFIREDLNASGVYDGVTTNLTCGILTHREGWKVGTLRQTTVSILRELMALWDQDVVVATTRMAFAQTVADGAANPHTAILYNVG